MADELERIWKVAFVASMCYPDIFLQLLRKIARKKKPVRIDCLPTEIRT
jgi:hypothetical protein